MAGVPARCSSRSRRASATRPGVVDEWCLKELLGHVNFWAEKAAHDVRCAGRRQARRDRDARRARRTVDEWNAREAAQRQGDGRRAAEGDWCASHEDAGRRARRSPRSRAWRSKSTAGPSACASPRTRTGTTEEHASTIKGMADSSWRRARHRTALSRRDIMAVRPEEIASIIKQQIEQFGGTVTAVDVGTRRRGRRRHRADLRPAQRPVLRAAGVPHEGRSRQRARRSWASR